jgi:hypothetical protein
MQQANPFPHADEAHAFALHNRFDIESHPRVADPEMNFPCMLHHSHFETARPAVLGGIMQSFL